MKPIKTKSKTIVKLYRMMDMDITEQQLKQAQAWYQSAKKSSKQTCTIKPKWS
jgi:predicted transposase